MSPPAAAPAGECALPHAQTDQHARAASLPLPSLRLPDTHARQRYDPVATGTGSLLVAGYCVVAQGQPVGEALNIAAAATVLGMVSGRRRRGCAGSRQPACARAAGCSYASTLLIAHCAHGRCRCCLLQVMQEVLFHGGGAGSNEA